MMTNKTYQEYEKDFYAWTQHNAELIRAGKLSEIDAEHIAEEIESMGRSDKRELINRLSLLIAHLLKWQFQSERRSNSWKSTIKEQRIKVLDLLEESPSLNHDLTVKLNHAYEQAVLIAMRETGLGENKFPTECPFSLEQCLNHAFVPENEKP